MNIKVCLVLLGICVAMTASRSMDKEVLRKLILKRLNELNEIEVARKDLGHDILRRGIMMDDIRGKMLLGKPAAAGDPLQMSLNALRSAIFSYEDAFGTKDASALAINLARLVGGIASAETAEESSNVESPTTNENPATANGDTTTAEVTDSSSTSSSTASSTTSMTSTTTTEAPPTPPSTTAPPDTMRILQQLLRELNIRRK